MMKETNLKDTLLPHGLRKPYEIALRNGDEDYAEYILQTGNNRMGLIDMRMIFKGHKIYLVANSPSHLTNPNLASLSLVPEEGIRMIRERDLKHGRDTKVVCEMIFDGDNLLISQHVSRIKLKEREKDVSVVGEHAGDGFTRV